jgi:hypothetical protein
MHPFSKKTFYAILLAFLSYAICYFVLRPMHGLVAIMLKSIAFTALYGGSIVYFDLSPDVVSLWGNIKSWASKMKNRLT